MKQHLIPPPAVVPAARAQVLAVKLRDDRLHEVELLQPCNLNWTHFPECAAFRMCNQARCHLAYVKLLGLLSARLCVFDALQNCSIMQVQLVRPIVRTSRGCSAIQLRTPLTSQPCNSEALELFNDDLAFGWRGVH